MATRASKGAVDAAEGEAEDDECGAGAADATVVRSVSDGMLESRSPAERVEVVEDWTCEAA